MRAESSRHSRAPRRISGMRPCHPPSSSMSTLWGRPQDPLQDPAPNQLVEMVSDRRDGDWVPHQDPKLHVAIKGVVRQICAADQRNIIDDGALRMKLSWAASLVRFTLRGRPVIEMQLGCGYAGECPDRV